MTEILKHFLGRSLGHDPHLPNSQTHRERFCAIVEAERAPILAAYQQRLRDQHNPIASDTHSLEQALAHGAEVITDVLFSIRCGAVRIDDRYKLLAWAIGEARAEHSLRPAESLHASVALFDITADVFTRHLADDPDLLPSFNVAIRALNDSISRRIRAGSLAYSGYLLDRVHRAHTDERRRIARDMHDYLGEALTMVLRQLELYEIAARKQPGFSSARTDLAKDALGEAMLRLRTVASDLRRDPVTNLEKALLRYIESAAADTLVQLRVSGDETWAPPSVTDEAFPIIREAIKNALTHAAPAMILIAVVLTPDELSAWIDDDGCGFSVENSDSDAGGGGLASMRERAALLAARLTVTSVLGEGTHVEIHIPLPGSSDD